MHMNRQPLAVQPFQQQQKLSLWTRSVFVAAVAAMVLLGVSFCNVYQASKQPMLVAAPERINPNTALLASLVRLPGIGKARAMDMIHYRNRMTNAAGEPAFQTARDMEKIKGIGPKTSRNMAPYLTFETEPETE